MIAADVPLACIEGLLAAPKALPRFRSAPLVVSAFEHLRGAAQAADASSTRLIVVG